MEGPNVSKPTLIEHLDYLTRLVKALTHSFSAILPTEDALTVAKFTSFPKAVEQWDKRRDFKPLLRTVVVNDILDILRTEKRSSNHIIFIGEQFFGKGQAEFHLEQIPEIGPSPAELVDFYDWVDALPQDEKCIVNLVLENKVEGTNITNMRGNLRRWLQDAGWSLRKIWKTEKHIQEKLSERVR